MRKVKSSSVLPDLRKPLLDMLEENLVILQGVRMPPMLPLAASMYQRVLGARIGILQCHIAMLKNLIAGRGSR